MSSSLDGLAELYPEDFRQLRHTICMENDIRPPSSLTPPEGPSPATQKRSISSMLTNSFSKTSKSKPHVGDSQCSPIAGSVQSTPDASFNKRQGQDGTGSVLDLAEANPLTETSTARSPARSPLGAIFSRRVKKASASVTPTITTTTTDGCGEHETSPVAPDRLPALPNKPAGSPKLKNIRPEQEIGATGEDLDAVAQAAAAALMAMPTAAAAAAADGAAAPRKPSASAVRSRQGSFSVSIDPEVRQPGIQIRRNSHESGLATQERQPGMLTRRDSYDSGRPRHLERRNSADSLPSRSRSNSLSNHSILDALALANSSTDARPRRLQRQSSLDSVEGHRRTSMDDGEGRAPVSTHPEGRSRRGSLDSNDTRLRRRLSDSGRAISDALTSLAGKVLPIVEAGADDGPTGGSPSGPSPAQFRDVRGAPVDCMDAQAFTHAAQRQSRSRASSQIEDRPAGPPRASKQISPKSENSRSPLVRRGAGSSSGPKKFKAPLPFDPGRKTSPAGSNLPSPILGGEDQFQSAGGDSARHIEHLCAQLAQQNAEALAQTESRIMATLQRERLLIQKLLAGVTSSGVDSAMLRVMPFYLANGATSTELGDAGDFDD